MAKYKVLKSYHTRALNKTFEIGEEVEYSDEEFKEVEDSLEEWGGGFLKKVEQPKKRAKKVVDEE